MAWQKGKGTIWFKAVAMVVVCLFTFNTVSWAAPGLFKKNNTDSCLQPQSNINPIISQRAFHEMMIKFYTKGIIDSLQKPEDIKLKPKLPLHDGLFLVIDFEKKVIYANGTRYRIPCSIVSENGENKKDYIVKADLRQGSIELAELTDVDLIDDFYWKKQKSGDIPDAAVPTSGITPEGEHVESGLYAPTGTETIVEIAQSFLKGKKDPRVLILGGGTGMDAAIFSKYARVRSVEIDPEYVDRANRYINELDEKGVIDKKRIDFVHGNFFDEDLSGYDLVYIFWPMFAKNNKEKLEQLQRNLAHPEKGLDPGAVFVLYSLFLDIKDPAFVQIDGSHLTTTPFLKAYRKKISSFTSKPKEERKKERYFWQMGSGISMKSAGFGKETAKYFRTRAGRIFLNEKILAAIRDSVKGFYAVTLYDASGGEHLPLVEGGMINVPVKDPKEVYADAAKALWKVIRPRKLKPKVEEWDAEGKRLLNTHDPEMIERILACIEWDAEKMDPDHLFTRRSMWLKLKEPVIERGITFRYVKIKGITYDGVLPPSSERYEEGPAAGYKVDKHGIITKHKHTNISGSMTQASSENEFDAMGPLFETGISGERRLARGFYKDIRLDGKKGGFVVMLVPEVPEITLEEMASNNYLRFWAEKERFEKEGPSAKALSKEAAAETEKITDFIYNHGIQVRKGHDAGCFFKYPHFNNCLLFSGENGPEYRMKDFDSTEIIDRGSNPEMMVSCRTVDIFQAVQQYEAMGDWYPMLSAVLEHAGIDPVKLFLKGYFHDRQDDPRLDHFRNYRPPTLDVPAAEMNTPPTDLIEEVEYGEEPSITEEVAKRQDDIPASISDLDIVWTGDVSKDGLRVACAQIERGRFDEDTARMGQIVRDLQVLGRNAPDLVIFPEEVRIMLDSPGGRILNKGEADRSVLERRTKALEEVARQTGAAIGFCVSININETIYTIVHPDGRKDTFKKMHYTEEDRLLTIKTPSGDYKIAVLICVEASFALGLAENVKLKNAVSKIFNDIADADLLIIPTNAGPDTAFESAEIFHERTGKPVVSLNLPKLLIDKDEMPVMAGGGSVFISERSEVTRLSPDLFADDGILEGVIMADIRKEERPAGGEAAGMPADKGSSGWSWGGKLTLFLMSVLAAQSASAQTFLDKVNEYAENNPRTFSVVYALSVGVMVLTFLLAGWAWKRYFPVSWYKKDLNDGNWSVRAEAVRKLGRTGHPSAIEYLKKNITEEPDYEIRRIAVEALAENDGTAAIEALKGLLKNSDDMARKFAIEFLSEMNLPEAVDVLILALEDKKDVIRRDAALALGNKGDRRAIGPLGACLLEKGPAVDHAMVVVLNKLGGPEAIRTISRALKKYFSDNSFAAKAAYILRKSEEKEILISEFGEDHENVLKAYSGIDDPQRIAGLGRSAVPVLVERYKAGDILAAEPLLLINDREALTGEFGPRYEQKLRADIHVRRKQWKEAGRQGAYAVPYLARALESRRIEDRRAAAETLLTINDRGEFRKELTDEVLNAHILIAQGKWDEVAGMGRSAIPALRASLKNPEQGINIKSIKALGEIGDAGASDDLIEVLASFNVDARRVAAEALGKTGGDKAFEALTVAEEDKEIKVRVAAITSLGLLRDPRAVDLLILRLRDREKRIRNAAIKALANMGELAAEPLGELLTGGIVNYKLGEDIIAALGESRSPKAIPFLVASLDNYYLRIFEAANEALKKIRGPDSVDMWMGYVEYRRTPVRELAIEILGESGEARVINALFRAMKDRNAGIRKAAAEALSKIGVPAFEILAETLGNSEEETDLRINAARALGRMKDARTMDARVVTVLSSAAKDPNPDIRRAAVEGLARSGTPQAVGVLSGIAQNGEEKTDTRIKAVKALSDSGGPAVIRTLIKILHSKHSRKAPAREHKKLISYVAKAIERLGIENVPEAMGAEAGTGEEVKTLLEIGGPGVVPRLIELAPVSYSILLAQLMRSDVSGLARESIIRIVKGRKYPHISEEVAQVIGKNILRLEKKLIDMPEFVKEPAYTIHHDAEYEEVWEGKGKCKTLVDHLRIDEWDERIPEKTVRNAEYDRTVKRIDELRKFMEELKAARGDDPGEEEDVSYRSDFGRISKYLTDEIRSAVLAMYREVLSALSGESVVPLAIFSNEILTDLLKKNDTAVIKVIFRIARRMVDLGYEVEDINRAFGYAIPNMVKNFKDPEKLNKAETEFIRTMRFMMDKDIYPDVYLNQSLPYMLFAVKDPQRALIGMQMGRILIERGCPNCAAVGYGVVMIDKATKGESTGVFAACMGEFIENILAIYYTEGKSRVLDQGSPEEIRSIIVGSAEKAVESVKKRPKAPVAEAVEQAINEHRLDLTRFGDNSVARFAKLLERYDIRGIVMHGGCINDMIKGVLPKDIDIIVKIPLTAKEMRLLENPSLTTESIYAKAIEPVEKLAEALIVTTEDVLHDRAGFEGIPIHYMGPYKTPDGKMGEMIVVNEDNGELYTAVPYPSGGLLGLDCRGNIYDSYHGLLDLYTKKARIAGRGIKEFNNVNMRTVLRVLRSKYVDGMNVDKHSYDLIRRYLKRAKKVVQDAGRVKRPAEGVIQAGKEEINRILRNTDRPGEFIEELKRLGIPEIAPWMVPEDKGPGTGGLSWRTGSALLLTGLLAPGIARAAEAGGRSELSYDMLFWIIPVAVIAIFLYEYFNNSDRSSGKNNKPAGKKPGLEPEPGPKTELPDGVKTLVETGGAEGIGELYQMAVDVNSNIGLARAAVEGLSMVMISGSEIPAVRGASFHTLSSIATRRPALAKDVFRAYKKILMKRGINDVMHTNITQEMIYLTQTTPKYAPWLVGILEEILLHPEDVDEIIFKKAVENLVYEYSKGTPDMKKVFGAVKRPGLVLENVFKARGLKSYYYGILPYAVERLLEDRPEHAFEILGSLERVLDTASIEREAYDAAVKSTFLLLGKKPEVLRSPERIRGLIEGLMRASMISFEGGGQTVCNYGEFMELLLDTSHRFKLEETPSAVPGQRKIAKASIPLYRGMSQKIRNYTFVMALGRTLIYKTDEGEYLAMKVLKKGEDPGILEHESRMLHYIRANKKRFGLVGDYPRPALHDGQRVVRVRELPPEALAAFRQQQTKSGETIEIDNEDGSYTFMAYKAKTLDYFTYLSDPSLTNEQFYSAFFKNLHDLFILAKFGIMQTAIIELFHNFRDRKRRVDWGIYIWMTDAITRLQRGGAGRLYGWANASNYPNVRLSGVADWGDSDTLANLMEPSNRTAFPLKNIMKGEALENEKYYLAFYLGNYLLSMALIAAKRSRDKDMMDWDNEEHVKDIAEEMKRYFEFAYETFTGRKAEDEVPDIIDWKRLARQMCFFMAKGDTYAPFVLANKVPEDMFAEGVELRYPRDISDSVGWTYTDDKKGWYADGVNPDLGPVDELIKALHVYVAYMIANHVRAPTGLKGPRKGSGSETGSGLVGKYAIVSAIGFSETKGKGKFNFLAYDIDDPDETTEPITITGERAPPEEKIFTRFKRTEIPEIDDALEKIVSSVREENTFLINLNDYGIYGFGTESMLAITEFLKDDPVAVFHEACHAAIEAGMLSVDTIIEKAGGEEALDAYISRENKSHRKDPKMRVHYAIRLFQHKMWPEEDKMLGQKIRLITYKYATVASKLLNIFPFSFPFKDKAKPYREKLWIEGRPEDVKRGDYFVNLSKKKDRFIEGEGRWHYGLSNNVSMNIGSTRVLVMDNHTFALPYLIQMQKEGVLGRDASMAHIDHHEDLEMNKLFEADEYAGRKEEYEKLRYLLQNANEENWQKALFNNGVVDKEKWQYISISTREDSNISPGEWVTKFSDQDNEPLGMDTLAVEADIIDIDIDVLSEMDEGLSDGEKRAVLKGAIPEKILRKIKDIALAASRARVVTIATSPGYINQGRAFVYTKELLRRIEKQKDEEKPEDKADVRSGMRIEEKGSAEKQTKRNFLLRDLDNPDQLARNLVELMVSSALAHSAERPKAQKVVLAFDGSIATEEAVNLFRHIKKLKKDYEKLLQNIDIVIPKEGQGLLAALEEKGGPGQDNTQVFVFAEKAPEDGLDWARSKKNVQPVYIQRSEDFKELHYYPLAEIVTITLARYLTDGRLTGFTEEELKAINLAGKPFENKAGTLIFKLLPRIERLDFERNRDRYAILRQFIEAA